MKKTKRRFKTFVKHNKQFLSRENKETIIKVLSSHGRDEELLFFAELVKDYERVLTHHIQQVRRFVRVPQQVIARLRSHCTCIFAVYVT